MPSDIESELSQIEYIPPDPLQLKRRGGIYMRSDIENVPFQREYTPPLIDSTVDNPRASTDVIDDLPQPVIAQEPQAFALVEPHVELSTLDPPEPAVPEIIITEALVDEPTPYSVEPMEESIKDFELIDQANNTAENTTTAPRITQSVLDMPQYVNLGLLTASPTPTNCLQTWVCRQLSPRTHWDT